MSDGFKSRYQLKERYYPNLGNIKHLKAVKAVWTVFLGRRVDKNMTSGEAKEFE